LSTYSYETLSEALADLTKRGYNNDFNLHSDCIECKGLNIKLKPEDFEIDEYYRFEGNTDPGDEEIVYAISSIDGTKGVLVDAFGVYADEISPEILSKLKIER
jgi:hypothetical protein